MTNAEQLYSVLLTVAMGSLGIREFFHFRFSFGVWLVAIPACFWISKALIP